MTTRFTISQYYFYHALWGNFNTRDVAMNLVDVNSNADYVYPWVKILSKLEIIK